MTSAVLGGMLEHGPIRTLDCNVMLRLMRVAIYEGRDAKPQLVTSIRSEHDRDVHLTAMCFDLGLPHVLFWPSRVKVARETAARVALGVEGPVASA